MKLDHNSKGPSLDMVCRTPQVVLSTDMAQHKRLLEDIRSIVDECGPSLAAWTSDKK